MKRIETTPFEVAGHFLGVREIPGTKDHPLILWGLHLCGLTEAHDEEAWCSGFVQIPFHALGLPRTRSARARSWLRIGMEIPIELAEPGFDVAVLKRGIGPQLGPGVIDAPGHVGLFAGLHGDRIMLRGGNQGDAVSDALFPLSSLLRIGRVTA